MSGRRFWSAAAASAALIAAGLSLASDSNAAWSRPFTVARCECASGPAVAASPKRGTTLVWIDSATYKVAARRIAPDGSLRWKRTLGDGDYNVPGPWIAMGRSGTAVALWYEGADLHARRMTRHGRLGRIHRIGSSGTFPPRLDADIALDAAGNATITWPRSVTGAPAPDEIQVRARRLTVKGELGPTIDLPRETA